MLHRLKCWFVIVAGICLLFSGVVQAQTGDDITIRLNDALSRTSSYEYGKSREALTDINEIVQTVLNTPAMQKPVEKQFLAFLQSDATLAGKQFVCRKLSLVGSKASIPVLSKMLEQKETFDMALFALARIPAPTVDRVLRQNIPKTKGDQQVGIVSTLGERKDSKSVKALGNLIYGNPEIADAALSALGNIGGQEVIDVLSEAITTLSGQRRDAAMNAYMRCADQLVQDGRVSQAKAIYQKFMVPDAIRASALTGMIQAEPDKADEIILTILQGGDSRIKSVAIRHLSRLPKVDFLDKIAAEIPKLESIHQIQLLAALAERGDRSILPAVVDATRSDNGEVRLAAIDALGVLGDGSTVDLLMKFAAVQGEEREAARASLYRMRGEDVDQKMLDMLADAEPAVRAELLKGVGERSIVPAAETVLSYTGDPESKVREEAIKTMGLIASADQVPDLIKVLNKVESDRERQAAENSVVAAARKVEDNDNQAKDVLAAMPSVKGVKAKSSMLHVLGRIGDVHALPEIREGLKSRNLDIRKASVRALSGWPTGEPLADLFKVAETSRQKSLKILAVRGAIQLIGVDKNLSGDNKVSMYKKALDLSTELNEKRMILAGLRGTRSLKALNMAGKYLDDPALKREAQVAVIQIGERIFENHPKEVLDFLVKVSKETEDDGIREWVEEILAEIEAQQ